MMRIMTLPAVAGPALVGFTQVTAAADNGQPPGAGTSRPSQDNALPMDRHGVIRPPGPNDPNQAEVPGTRDNPDIVDRNRRLDHGPTPPAPPKGIDRDQRP